MKMHLGEIHTEQKIKQACNLAKAYMLNWFSKAQIS